MALFLGVLLFLTALTLAAVATAQTSATPTTGVGRSIAALEALGQNLPKELTEEIDRPFSERVLEPFQERALQIARRISGRDSAERIHRKLELAGNPTGWTVERVMAMKVIGAVVGLLVGLLGSAMFGSGAVSRVAIAAVCIAVGYLAMDFWLYQVSYDRQERLGKELPDSVDLMTISVESGLAFDAAIQQVARNTEGPLADEFGRVLHEMQIGRSRAEALRGLADRTNLDDLRSFVSALVQADAFGIPIGQVLRVQSAEMRTKRRQAAEAKAQQVAVKMTIPLIMFILPTLFIVVIGPAALSIMDTF